MKQNAAIHLWLRQIAEKLNESGLSIQQVLKNTTMDIEWTEAAVKEILWRTAQKRMFGKTSTTELDKLKEITKTVDVLTRFLGQLGVEIPPLPHYCTENCTDDCEGLKQL